MKNYKVIVNGTAYEVAIEEIDASAVQAQPAAPVAPAAPAAPAAAPAAGANTISSPMPGTILSVNVAVGDTVKKGDVLMVLEAMKMENEIMAPADGKVASLGVTKGQAVESGTVLCTLA